MGVGLMKKNGREGDEDGEEIGEGKEGDGA